MDDYSFSIDDIVGFLQFITTELARRVMHFESDAIEVIY